MDRGILAAYVSGAAVVTIHGLDRFRAWFTATCTYPCLAQPQILAQSLGQPKLALLRMRKLLFAGCFCGFGFGHVRFPQFSGVI